jgi:Lantibiotic dehydratase, N terminus
VNEPWTPRLGRWRLWPQFALRGPGFPASGVSRLAPRALADEAAGLAPAEPLAGEGWQAFAERFDAAAVEWTQELQAVAASPAFQSAVAWQNRTVLETGIAPFLRWDAASGKRNSMVRQRAELVAHYWQRFCVKNDTIGFFGPVGWGAWDSTVKGVVVEPGAGLVATAEVYFASWAIDAVARSLDADPALRAWMAPRRVPYVRIAGDAVVTPARPPQPVEAHELRILELCDGARSARDIQAELGPGVDVPATLDHLVKRRWVVWRVDVPVGAHPDRRLRTVLERVGDPDARERALGALAVLERGRDRVRAAYDDVHEVTAAMAGLEADFEALTSTAAQRVKGARTAPCRGLVYADTVRSTRVRVGPGLLDAMAPMEHLFTAAAWLTSSLAERVMTRVRAVVERHTAGGTPLDLATCWFACMPVLHGDAAADATELQHEFWRRWQDILGAEPGLRRVELTGAQLGRRVRDAFGNPVPGWTAAGHLCPDVLVTAPDPESLARGEVDLVLGEVHLAANTLGESLFVNQHPVPAELFALTDRDHPGPRLLPAVAKEHRARLSTRVRYALERPYDYAVTLVDHVADPDGARPVPSADVLVEDRDGRLVTVLPDGAVFDLVDVFGHVLTNFARDMFRILPEAEHTPRVTVDHLVAARETWRIPAADLAFADEKDGARRFVRAVQWRLALGLPRFVFVVSPTEPRPFYVDLDSPAYVDILAKAMRRLARSDPQASVAVSEMLPTPEQTWLTDDRGRGYTSELRFVAVDTAVGDRT